MKTTSAKLILFPQKTKKGFPLKIRISKDRKSKYIGLKFYLTQGQRVRYWNKQKNELLKSFTQYDEVMSAFNNELQKLGINKNEEDIFNNINNKSFSQYLKGYMDALFKKKQYGLLQKTTSVYNHLLEFRKVKTEPEEIMFNEITIDFLNELQLYFEDKNIQPITQRGYFEKIRRVINKAINENKFNPQRHPYLGFEFKRVNTKPKCLEPQQFKLIKGFVLGNIVRYNITNGKKVQILLTEREKKSGFMFLFQYYSYGMRVSDLLQLQWKNIYESGTRFKYVMYKTKTQMDLSISKELLDILFEFLPEKLQSKINTQTKQQSEIKKVNLEDGNTLKYKNKTEKYELIRYYLFYLSRHKELKYHRIFSNIPSEINEKSLFTKIQSQTTYYNKGLTDFSIKIGLNEELDCSLSSHMSRHTFAYLSLLNGQSIYYISKALNHKSIKTTEAYLRKFTNRQLDGKFYKDDIRAIDKKEIDEELKIIINSSDYEKKKKIIEFFNL